MSDIILNISVETSLLTTQQTLMFFWYTFMVFVYGNHEGDFQGWDTNGIKPSFRYQYKHKSVTPKTVYFELEKCLSVNIDYRFKLTNHDSNQTNSKSENYQSSRYLVPVLLNGMSHTVWLRIEVGWGWFANKADLGYW